MQTISHCIKVKTGWPAIFEMRIQEQFKNISRISIIFKNTSDVENIITLILNDENLSKSKNHEKDEQSFL